MKQGGVDSDKVGPPAQSRCASRFGKLSGDYRSTHWVPTTEQRVYLGIDQQENPPLGRYLGV